MTMVLDKKKLLNELLAAESEEKMNLYDNSQEIRTMFLLLANDPREIKKTTLSELAMLFNDASDLLNDYKKTCEDWFDLSCLKDVKPKRRVL